MNTSISNLHSFDDKDQIKGTMLNYEKLWSSNSMGNQTGFFRKNIPMVETDFTDVYTGSNLDKFFTLEGLRLKLGHNCNHLFRSSKDVPHILLYSTPQYSVIHPLGEPGRDLGVNKGRISHLMIITTGDGEITMNELLPSNENEVQDLKERLKVGDKVYELLRNNSPISECGAKVLEKAETMGIPASTPIRSFMVKQIMCFDEEFRGGIPGYKLFNSESLDISGNEAALQSLVDSVFTDEGLRAVKCIQPPFLNTQLLSHIHLFLLSEIPPLISEKYVNVEVVLSVKEEKVHTLNKQLDRIKEPLDPQEVADCCTRPEEGVPPEPEPEPEPESMCCMSLTRTVSLCHGNKNTGDDLVEPLSKSSVDGSFVNVMAR